jgi:hypothetical protein
MRASQARTLLDGMGEIKAASRKTMAYRPGIERRRRATKGALPRASDRVQMLCFLEFAVEQFAASHKRLGFPVSFRGKTDGPVIV